MFVKEQLIDLSKSITILLPIALSNSLSNTYPPPNQKQYCPPLPPPLFSVKYNGFLGFIPLSPFSIFPSFNPLPLFSFVKLLRAFYPYCIIIIIISAIIIRPSVSYGTAISVIPPFAIPTGPSEMTCRTATLREGARTR